MLPRRLTGSKDVARHDNTAPARQHSTGTTTQHRHNNTAPAQHSTGTTTQHRHNNTALHRCCFASHRNCLVSTTPADTQIVFPCFVVRMLDLNEHFKRQAIYGGACMKPVLVWVCVRVGVFTRSRSCAFARVGLLIQHVTHMRHIV